jgi:DNA polymerase-3 subunit alpha
LSEVDRIAKLIPNTPNITLRDALEKAPEFKQLYESSDETKQIIDWHSASKGVCATSAPMPVAW